MHDFGFKCGIFVPTLAEVAIVYRKKRYGSTDTKNVFTLPVALIQSGVSVECSKRVEDAGVYNKDESGSHDVAAGKILTRSRGLYH